MDLIFENPIKIAAAFISMLALFAAFYHGYVTRRHFKLSVMPHLCFEFGKLFDDNTIHITVMNHGLGPAIIKNFIIIKGSTQIRAEGPTQLSDLIMNSARMEYIYCYSSVPHKHESIPANGKIKLVSIQLDPDTIEKYNIDVLLNRIIPLSFKIEYESMYGKKLSAEYPPKFHDKVD